MCFVNYQGGQRKVPATRSPTPSGRMLLTHLALPRHRSPLPALAASPPGPPPSRPAPRNIRRAAASFPRAASFLAVSFLGPTVARPFPCSLLLGPFLNYSDSLSPAPTIIPPSLPPFCCLFQPLFFSFCPRFGRVIVISIVSADNVGFITLFFSSSPMLPFTEGCEGGAASLPLFARLRAKHRARFAARGTRARR